MVPAASVATHYPRRRGSHARNWAPPPLQALPLDSAQCPAQPLSQTWTTAVQGPFSGQLQALIADPGGQEDKWHRCPTSVRPCRRPASPARSPETEDHRFSGNRAAMHRWPAKPFFTGGGRIPIMAWDAKIAMPVEDGPVPLCNPNADFGNRMSMTTPGPRKLRQAGAEVRDQFGATDRNFAATAPIPTLSAEPPPFQEGAAQRRAPRCGT